jgi:hypothetical protein
MMVESSLKLIVARRSYEFPPDELRLSLITTQPVMDVLRTTFSFGNVQIGQPMPIISDVPRTIPPGLVLDNGHIVVSAGQVVPIRFIHFEPRRVIIDVAGASTAIDAIYAILRQILEGLQAADGSPAMGELQAVIDYSELTFHADTAPINFLAPKLRKAMVKHIDHTVDTSLVLVPSIRVTAQAPSEDYPGALNPWGERSLFVLEHRAGTKPEDGILYSAASLDTDAHLAYLRELQPSAMLEGPADAHS